MALTGQRTFLRESFVGYALFHVVGFTGEYHERFVLGLPAETGDGAVVAVAVEGAGDANVVALSGLIVQERCVVDVFDEARAKKRVDDEAGIIERQFPETGDVALPPPRRLGRIAFEPACFDKAREAHVEAEIDYIGYKLSVCLSLIPAAHNAERNSCVRI